MASELEPSRATDDTVVVAADEITQTEDDWPLAEAYRVGPTGASLASERQAVVVAQGAPPTRRRLPDVGPGVLLAIAATVLALLVGAVLLEGLRTDESASPVRAGPVRAGKAPAPPAERTSPNPAVGAIEVRDLVGMSLADATAMLEELGLGVRVSRQASNEPRGLILSQSPEAGAKVARGDEIALVVARGAPAEPEPPVRMIGVPGVVGRSASDAVVAVRDAGLEARIRLVDSSERAGVVLRQTPAEGIEAPAGSTVRLDVSRNRPAASRVEVPDVVGLGASEARQRLRSMGFAVSIARVRSKEPAGTVLEQSPRAGAELRKGGLVTLTVSTGPAKVQVPDVTGLDEDSARLELESAGFQVRVTDESTDDPSQDGVVVRQSPAGGSAEAEGSVVTLVVARLG